MRNRILLFLCVFAGLLQTATAQPLFLPTTLNTIKRDVPVAFAEYKGAYYFAGTQWPTQAGEASHGFCYRTDSAGNVLQTFQLNGTDSLRAYRFEAVYPHNDQIFILASVSDTFKNRPFLWPAYYNNVLQSGFDFNKLLLIRLDNTLAVRRVDTLKYDTDSTDLLNLRTVMINGKLFAAYTGLRPFTTSQPYYNTRSFITVYDLNNSGLTHQPIDSAFLTGAVPQTATWTYGNEKNGVLSLTRTGEDQLLMGCYLSPFGALHGFQEALQIDTNLTITRLPLTGNYSFQPAGLCISQDYLELWKPTATSSYFTGPIIYRCDSNLLPFRTPMTIGRLDSATHTIIASPAPPHHPTRYRDENYWQASKNPMTLLRDRAHFIVTCDAWTRDLSSQIDTARIRIAKYDTSLNLIWSRDFGRPYSFFTTAGVHELSNHKLMVISAADDAIAGGTTELHCFIIDPNGTPLNTFTVATTAPNGVKIYPNPAQNEIRVSLPDGQANATYILTDMSGRTVQEGTLISGNPVSVSALPAANYLFRIQTADQKTYSGVFTKQ